MGQVWGIGKRRFGKDWGKRIWLFDRLVWTVMGYGVEIWGWKERERMEKLEEKYLRWVLGVEYSTPWYLVREELQREKIRCRAWRRAWGFERRLEEGRGGAIARKWLGGEERKSEDGKGSFGVGEGEREIRRGKRDSDERVGGGMGGWNKQMWGVRKVGEREARKGEMGKNQRIKVQQMV